MQQKLPLLFIAVACITLILIALSGPQHTPKPTPQAESIAEAEPAPQAESTAEAEPAPQAESTAEAEPAPQAESTAEAEPAPQAESDTRTVPPSETVSSEVGQPDGHETAKTEHQAREPESASSQAASETSPQTIFARVANAPEEVWSLHELPEGGLLLIPPTQAGSMPEALISTLEEKLKSVGWTLKQPAAGHLWLLTSGHSASPRHDQMSEAYSPENRGSGANPISPTD